MVRNKNRSFGGGNRRLCVEEVKRWPMQDTGVEPL